MPDAREQGGPLGIDRGTFRLEFAEPRGQLIERPGDVAELVLTVHRSPHSTVAALDRADRRLDAAGIGSQWPGGDENEHDGEDRGDSEHTQHVAGLSGLQDHEARQQHRGQGRQHQGTDGDGEEVGAQRAGPAQHAAQGDRTGDGAGGQRSERSDNGPEPLHAEGVDPSRAHGSNRYPTPHAVAIQRGWSGSVSSFWRRRPTCTVTVAGS